MYSLIDQTMRKKGGKLPPKNSKRTQAADRLKMMIQELMAENLDMRAIA